MSRYDVTLAPNVHRTPALPPPILWTSFHPGKRAAAPSICLLALLRHTPVLATLVSNHRLKANPRVQSSFRTLDTLWTEPTRSLLVRARPETHCYIRPATQGKAAHHRAVYPTCHPWLPLQDRSNTPPLIRCRCTCHPLDRPGHPGPVYTRLYRLPLHPTNTLATASLSRSRAGVSQWRLQSEARYPPRVAYMLYIRRPTSPLARLSAGLWIGETCGTRCAAHTC